MTDPYDLDLSFAEDIPPGAVARPVPIRDPETEPNPESATEESPPPTSTEPVRLTSLDAYRGFVMLAMASGGLGLGAVAAEFPGSPVWNVLKAQTSHVEWGGLAFWDLIQPSFMFIVGVAMPWAYANRKAQGESWWNQFGHAVVRSIVLVVLGVFLASNGAKQVNWTFTNVLAQIGLGYTFVFLILGWKPVWQFLAAIAILVGYGCFFAFWPLPGFEGRWPVTPDLATIGQHWAKNANAASDFDKWFLNLFPYPDGTTFKENPGGYTTLNFIPSMATAIFGVLVGRLLKKNLSAKRTLWTLILGGAVALIVGTVLDFTICPVVKRIWTPSWTLVALGWTCWLMGAFYLVVDVWGFRRAVFPFVVVGANSIAIYLMAQLMGGWIRGTLRTLLTTLTYVVEQVSGLAVKIPASGPLFEGTYAPLLQSAATLFSMWLICLWMYRSKIFVRI